MINVKDAPFGATGDGSTDDRAAIQRAVDFAKNLTLPNNAAVRYRVTIYFPAGFYYISGPINITNTNGLYLVGDGGVYLNTIVIGSTGGVIFDFSGSSLSGCENFTFITSTRNSLSTIGALFALTTNGGLNCGIRKCYFEMADTPTANGTFGSIGVLNVRSEEFFMHECLVRANTPLIMSYTAVLNSTGVNYTVASPFQTLAVGDGSMGVTSINGTSLQTLEKRRPAMVLLGTNSLNFQGYLGRLSANTGTNESAILCVGYTTNLKIHATVESFSQILKVLSAGFEGNELDIVSANASAPTTNLIDFTGCTVKGLKLKVSLPVIAERSNRILLFYQSDSNPNQQTPGFLKNSEITCYDMAGNQFIISPNLLKKCENVVFNTERPFEKRAGRIRLLGNINASAGNNGSITPASVLQFRQADVAASTNSRGGYYRVWLDGVIRAGSYGSGGSAVMSFQAQVIINQNFSGTFDTPASTTITIGKSVSSPAYLDISGVSVGISFANGIGTVTATPRVSGQGQGEIVYYDGTVEIQSDYLVNDPIPL